MRIIINKFMNSIMTIRAKGIASWMSTGIG